MQFVLKLFADSCEKKFELNKKIPGNIHYKTKPYVVLYLLCFSQCSGSQCSMLLADTLFSRISLNV